MRRSPDTPAKPPPGFGWRAIRSILPFLWQYRGRVGIALAFLLAAKLANVAVPFALKGIVDHLDAPDDALLTIPLSLLIAYGTLRLFSSVFGELRDAIFARVTQHTIRRVAIRVFEHLHALSLRFHLDRKTGGMSRDIERGTRSISFLLSFLVFNILPTLVEIGLVVGILLFNYSPWFGILTFVTLGTYILFTVLVTEWRMKFRRTMNETDSQANTRAIDSLINYETVKYFGNEAYEARRYDGQMALWEAAAVKNQTSLSALNAGQGAIIALGVSLLMYLASKQVVGGEMSLGDLVLINTYLLQLYMPMNFLGFVYREIKHSLADMERMFSLLEEKTEIADRPDARTLQVTRGAVEFEKVSFAYRPDRPILHEVGFEVPPGWKVAVVGPSGAGKSTLVRLLFRFFDVNGGRILIDGQDIREVTQQSLRAAIGIVPQDTVLFNDTLYNNIAYGRPDADRDAVVRAARMAHIHEFIESLPDGYETLVGERGLKLSGGEKQRVAIARTILKSPPIMVFDEATSSLDSQSEQAILAALDAIAARHTTLVIAHRLSTVVDADRIMVMEAGRIVESGTHRELLAAEGLYAKLWALQREEREHGVSPALDGAGLDASN